MVEAGLTLTRKDAIGIYSALGFHTAKRWPSERLGSDFKTLYLTAQKKQDLNVMSEKLAGKPELWALLLDIFEVIGGESRVVVAENPMPGVDKPESDLVPEPEECCASVEPEPSIDDTADIPPRPEPTKSKSKSKPKKRTGMSMLTAAAVVLEENPKPMKVNEIVESMADRGLWTSPGGKTPQATLAGAIGTEIKKKGDRSRFAKAGVGLFTSITNVEVADAS